MDNNGINRKLCTNEPRKYVSSFSFKSQLIKDYFELLDEYKTEDYHVQLFGGRMAYPEPETLAALHAIENFINKKFEETKIDEKSNG